MNIINDIERYEFDKVDITIISDIFYNGQTQTEGYPEVGNCFSVGYADLNHPVAFDSARHSGLWRYSGERTGNMRR